MFSTAEILEDYLTSCTVADVARYDRLAAWQRWKGDRAARANRKRRRLKGLVATCGWCGAEFKRVPGAGRPRGFCCSAHKALEMHERGKKRRCGCAAGGQLGFGWSGGW